MIDLTDKLPRASWSIGLRSGSPTGATLHYNGPPVAAFGNVAGEIRQLESDARYHMRPDVLSADGIQYHYAVLSDGQVARLRDDRAILWHCANASGNAHHLAIHLPLGGAQRPTDAQWRATCDLFDRLVVGYNWHSRNVILGHREWPRSDGKPQKSCPGPIVFRMLQIWRGQLHEAQPSHYRVTVDTALIREGPGQQFKVALNGAARLHRGDFFTVDSITHGTPPKGSTNPRWLHLGTGVGFIFEELATQV